MKNSFLINYFKAKYVKKSPFKGIEKTPPDDVGKNNIINVNSVDVPIPPNRDEPDVPPERVEWESIEGIRTTTDYIHLAEAMIVDLKDERTARYLYQRAEERADQWDEYLKLAESVYDYLMDRVYAKRIIDKIVEPNYLRSHRPDVKSALKLAEFISLNLKYEDWAKKIYKIAIKLIKEPVDLIPIAESEAIYLTDRGEAISLYKTTQNIMFYNHKLIQLAQSILKYLNDTEWAKTLYGRLEEFTYKSADCIALAESILDTFNDREWAKRIYQKAIFYTYHFNDRIHLGESIAGKLKETNWAGQIYHGADICAKTQKDWLKLAISVRTYLKDETYAKQAFMKAEKIGNLSFASYKRLAITISNYIDDPSFLKELYGRVEERVTTFSGFIELANLVSIYLFDQELLKHLYSEAGGKIRSITDFNKLSQAISRHLSDKAFEETLVMDLLKTNKIKLHYLTHAALSPSVEETCRKISIRFLTRKELIDKFAECLEMIEKLPPGEQLKVLKAFFSSHKMNKNIGPLYYRAVPLLAPLDRFEAIAAYLEYYRSGIIERGKGRPLPPGLKKKLFGNNRYSSEFLQIIDKLKTSHSVEQALEKAKQVFAPPQKNIRLDREKISDIHVQHADTVKKLTGVLSDETESGARPRHPVEPQNLPALTLESVFMPPPNEGTLPVVSLTPIQEALLKLFVENGFMLSPDTVSRFARTHNVFKHRLLDSIEEIFAAHFDDILIEETEQHYVLNGNYRNKLFDLLKIPGETKI
ncbi:MAG: tellurite resistance TerB C-terminal domain-containing protein [Candidatus Omnitrophota bacterium]